ncbi:hypothetical protein F8M41_001525 [Gigaspora margarita]|uniref:Uncharacterized protein n=1 Tax=Gigaspora margarita TaxID=4874 RepID=A0A8H3XEZ0_GIGMA|nr:hypothetical protein F8M41_001525 [Gigaspora margarita]
MPKKYHKTIHQTRSTKTNSLAKHQRTKEIPQDKSPETLKDQKKYQRQITRNGKGPEEVQRQFTSKTLKNKRNTTRQFTRNAKGPEEVPKTIQQQNTEG